MFADDTNISSIGNSPADIEVKLNNDLYNVNNWLMANKLTLNVKKPWIYANSLQTKIETILIWPMYTDC
jgi:hypothetical protein